ncbi:MAG: DUF979 domain-containing protein [Blastocatellia bacterium]|nr:DUF979 domain-containing protein [Blastocatellia bacterium]MBK6428692.1 DUF979 domain-containing protein [Blastocatellia bacterium]
MSLFDTLFTLEAVFVLSGLALAAIAALSFVDRANPSRFGTGAFWLLLAITFALGSVLPSWATGALVLAMVALDGFGLVRHGDYGEPTHAERAASATRLGNRILLPVLTIPVLTYGASLALAPLELDPNRVVYASLGYASIVAAVVALLVTRSRPRVLLDEGRRLADAVGAIVILPQLLAALGAVFRAAGVGDVIAKGVAAIVPTDSLFLVVVVCCTGIAAFTFILGNSFATFPLMMAGVGVPMLVVPFGADPALVGLMVLTAASCGTLCTPMAANFNIVPAALFEMRSPYGVIRFQAPFAAAMLVAHILMLWAFIAFGR